MLLETPYPTTGSQLATKTDERDASPAGESMPKPVPETDKGTVLHEKPDSADPAPEVRQ